MIYVGRDEVVLTHWWMGPRPQDDHWSALQGVGSHVVELRDPWPTNPWENVKSRTDFEMRATGGAPGVFSIVRLSHFPF